MTDLAHYTSEAITLLSSLISIPSISREEEKAADFLQTFEDLRPLLALTGGQITLDNVGPNEYLMRTYYGHFWFGVKNNRLYVTNNRKWAEEVGRTYGASLGVKPWSAEVKQNRLYASLNLASMANELSLFRSLPMLGGQQNTMIVKLFAGTNRPSCIIT